MREINRVTPQNHNGIVIPLSSRFTLPSERKPCSLLPPPPDLVWDLGPFEIAWKSVQIVLVAPKWFSFLGGKRRSLFPLESANRLQKLYLSRSLTRVPSLSLRESCLQVKCVACTAAKTKVFFVSRSSSPCLRAERCLCHKGTLLPAPLGMNAHSIDLALSGFKVELFEDENR